MAKKFTSNKKAWNKMKKNLKSLSKNKADVGFFNTVYTEGKNQGVPVAYIAQINNEGVGVPARDFMYFSLEEFKGGEAFKGVAKSLASEVALGTTGVSNAYYNWGYLLQEVVEDSIRKWSNPPNHPETIKQKGKDDPLRETDTMLNSVKVRVEGKVK